jgi:lysosomal alpha-mannosidase
MTYRIYSSSNFLEIDYSVGPLTPDRELISRFQTDLNTRGLFNTDSNVLQSIETVRINYPNDPKKDLFPVQSNYYATQYSSFIKDDSVQLTFTMNSTRGTSSLVDGQWEIMLHRRCLQDDEQGLAGYPLNDTDIVQLRVRVTLDKVEKEKAPHRLLRAHQLNFPPEVFIFKQLPANLTIENYKKQFLTRYEPVTEVLPTNLHLQTFQVQKMTDTFLLVRIVNTCDVDTAVLDLQKYFTFKISTIIETTLTANQPSQVQLSNLIIKLEPQQIRTFLVQFAK